MIAKEFETFLMSHLDNYLIPEQDLAIFIDTHNADHVMLLLVSNGFLEFLLSHGRKICGNH